MKYRIIDGPSSEDLANSPFTGWDNTVEFTLIATDATTAIKVRAKVYSLGRRVKHDRSVMNLQGVASINDDKVSLSFERYYDWYRPTQKSIFGEFNIQSMKQEEGE